MTYCFTCPFCGFPEEKEYSFKEFDQIKAKTLIPKCSECGGTTEMTMSDGTGNFIWFSDPKTVGTLAERNAKYRIPQAEEAEEKKREKRKAEGKFVPPKEITVPWEKPEIKIDRKQRKEIRKEHIAKHKPSRSSSRSNNGNKR